MDRPLKIHIGTRDGKDLSVVPEGYPGATEYVREEAFIEKGFIEDFKNYLNKKNNTLATIKSYTDIEQSKKLAEILSIESADMYYPNRVDTKYQGALPIEDKHGNPLLSQEIAAWSLTALLDLIPTPTLARLDDKEDGVWYCNTIKFGEDYFSYNGNYHDNPIDACIEVIKWLINNKHIKL